MTRAADRTRSPRQRAGSRRNKRRRNVPTFASDRAQPRAVNGPGCPPPPPPPPPPPDPPKR